MLLGLAKASIFDQTRGTLAGNVDVSITHSESCHMICRKNIPLASLPLVLFSADVLRFPDRPKVLGPNDEGSSRMSDEGCPNEGPSVDDATAYSKEEEEDNS